MTAVCRAHLASVDVVLQPICQGRDQGLKDMPEVFWSCDRFPQAFGQGDRLQWRDIGVRETFQQKPCCVADRGFKAQVSHRQTFEIGQPFRAKPVKIRRYQPVSTSKVVPRRRKAHIARYR